MNLNTQTLTRPLLQAVDLEQPDRHPPEHTTSQDTPRAGQLEEGPTNENPPRTLTTVTTTVSDDDNVSQCVGSSCDNI